MIMSVTFTLDFLKIYYVILLDHPAARLMINDE